MKAFTPYSKEERNLRQLLRKMEDYGVLTCDFQTFNKIYCEWHEQDFPGRPISTFSALFREDWLLNFLNFLANYEV